MTARREVVLGLFHLIEKSQDALSELPDEEYNAIADFMSRALNVYTDLRYRYRDLVQSISGKRR